MKVCCVSPDVELAAPTLAGQGIDSALDAWARALDAEQLTLAAFRSRPASAPPFDVALVEATATSLQTIAALRELLGVERPCLLVVYVSRSLPTESRQLELVREALAKADLVIAAQAGIAADIRRRLGMPAFALARPQRWANEASSKAEDASPPRRAQFSVLARPGYLRLAFLRDVGVVAYVRAALRFRLCFSNAEAPLSENAASLRQSRFVYLASSLEDGGALAAFCASVGAILLAPLCYEPARITFPYTIFSGASSAPAKRRRSSLLLWLLGSKDFVAFFRDTAQKRLRLLRDENCRVQFLRKIQYLEPRRADLDPSAPGGVPSLWEQIRHRSGPRATRGDADSCLVVCLVRNGREHLPSFLRHYRALGVREFVFVDNGSDDGTPEWLEQDSAITVYETSLPHKDYETQLRRLVIEEHCRHRWCLNVDVDELFDYPMSAQLELSGLLRYLRQRGATAMAGHMLDMYDREGRDWDGAELDLRAAYPNYDISRLQRTEYHTEVLRPYCDANVLQAEIPCFSGGIRETIFGSTTGTQFLLIKHPLIFLDGVLEPVTHPHYSNYATVADVTCVLYHYKFTPAFKAKALESRSSARYVKFAQEQYEQYLKKLATRDAFAIDTAGTQLLVNVDELLTAGFVCVSNEYRRFVAQAERATAFGDRDNANERHLSSPRGDGAMALPRVG